jgi:hypothetical protein
MQRYFLFYWQKGFIENYFDFFLNVFDEYKINHSSDKLLFFIQFVASR